jgi:hypothetical protein
VFSQPFKKKGSQIFHKPRSQLKILDPKRWTRNKFNTENPHTLGATVYDIIAGIWATLLEAQYAYTNIKHFGISSPSTFVSYYPHNKELIFLNSINQLVSAKTIQ